jgi:hypothetical protein
MMPLTAAIHFWVMADTHRVDGGLAGKNDRVTIQRQSNLESIEEKNARCALRQ